MVARGDGVGADAAVGRGQVHGEAGRRDHALAVVARRRVPLAEGGPWRRLCVVRRRRSLLVAVTDEVFPVVGVRGERARGRLARVLVPVGCGARGAGRREHLRGVHGRIRQQRAGRGGARRHRRRRRLARLA